MINASCCVEWKREIAVRLGAALILGSALGLNRELHGKPAGLRTHGLVSLGAVATHWPWCWHGILRAMSGRVSAPLDKTLAQFFKFSCEM